MKGRHERRQRKQKMCKIKKTMNRRNDVVGNAARQKMKTDRSDEIKNDDDGHSGKAQKEVREGENKTQEKKKETNVKMKTRHEKLKKDESKEHVRLKKK